MKVSTKKEYRGRRHFRIRKKIKGTASRPRMSVFISNRQIYVQLIDDSAENTLVAASTLSKDLKDCAGKPNAQAAEQLGKLVAEWAKNKGIESVVFDRGGFSYEGRIKIMADASRKAGLQF